MERRDLPPLGNEDAPLPNHEDRFWPALLLTALLLVVLAAALGLALYA